MYLSIYHIIIYSFHCLSIILQIALFLLSRHDCFAFGVFIWFLEQQENICIGYLSFIIRVFSSFLSNCRFCDKLRHLLISVKTNHVFKMLECFTRYVGVWLIEPAKTLTLRKYVLHFLINMVTINTFLITICLSTCAKKWGGGPAHVSDKNNFLYFLMQVKIYWVNFPTFLNA